MQVSQPASPLIKSNLIPAETLPGESFPSVAEVQVLELQQQTERERLVSKIMGRIHQSLDLQEILNTTVADVRHLLQTDRVIIFRFEANWSGIVEVESVDEGWSSILGLTIKDPCFQAVYEDSSQWKLSWAIENTNTGDLTQCYADLLSQFQVKANLVLPIIQGDKLWGLLIAHHCRSPRTWQPLEVELLKELATQAAIAIQQSELYHQVQMLNANLEQQVKERTQQLEQSLDFAAVLKRISDRIRDSLDERQILQTAVRELVSALKVDYCCAALYTPARTTAIIQYEFTHAELESAIGQVLEVADTPKVHHQLLSGKYFEAYDNGRVGYLQASETGDLACPPLFERFAAKLLCPIFLDPASCESSLDPGAPGACGVDPGAIGYLAVIDQTYHVFTDTEIKLVKQVANQCAIAIRQARLYQASQAQVEALEKLNRLKDDFLSTISHELRTPVASMKMAIQMLNLSLNQGGSTPSEKTVHYLNILNAQCEQEIGLINDLLDLQRLEAGTRSLKPTQIQLQDWLNQNLQPFQERSKTQQQRLQVNLAPNLPLLRCDLSCLERILTELLDNACKYSPSEATIRLNVWTQAETLYLSVSNSGVEIPAAEIPYVFDRFYRVPSQDPWKQKGTGLGLALVKKLVSHLNGSIQLRSNSKTTCFTVGIPL